MNFFFDLFRAADLLQHDGIDGIQAVKKRASKQMPIFQSLNMFASFHSGGSPKLREKKIFVTRNNIEIEIIIKHIENKTAVVKKKTKKI